MIFRNSSISGQSYVQSVIVQPPNQVQSVNPQITQQQAQQKPNIQNAQIRPGHPNQPVNQNSQQYVNSQQPQVSTTPANLSADDDAYNQKIEELQQHLPRLERMLQSATGKSNATEINKIKAFIDVIQRNKKVTMEILLRCESSLNVTLF